MKKINVCCVKSGDKYDSDYVNTLYLMVKRYLTVPFDFIRSAITSFDITHTPFKIMSVRLYVGNLSFDATADDLREIFGQTGEVVDSLIVTRPGGGRPRGFGFVTMADEAAGEEAIRQLDGQEVAGRALVVNVAKERQDGDS